LELMSIYLSVAYLLLNAASYDGEILHAHVYRPCAGRAGFYVYRGRRYENNDIFHKYMHTFAAVTSGQSVEHRQ